MNIFTGTITQIYDTLVNRFLRKDSVEQVGNTLEILNVCLCIQNPTLKNLCFPHRHVNERYAKEELRWYWSANNKCKDIGEHAQLWLNITDDGETNNSAYGYILHKKHNKDQLQEIITILKQDKNTRRAVLSIIDPTLDKCKTKDLQCTIAIQFLIRNNKLIMNVTMRSNDIHYGLPYDYIYFTSIGQYVASQLGIEFAEYNHIVASLHMYDKDVAKYTTECGHTFSIDAETIIKENYNAQ